MKYLFVHEEANSQSGKGKVNDELGASCYPKKEMFKDEAMSKKKTKTRDQFKGISLVKSGNMNIKINNDM